MLYAAAKLSGKFKLISLIPLTFSEGFIPITFSKFALLGLTKVSALSYAPKLRVNGIAPGFTLPNPNQSDFDFKRIQELNPMNFPRSNGNATIMPDGNIFINGGTSYDDLAFSVFTPEIYNPNTQETSEMSQAYFRRNYHSTSLLLADGRILTAGGDVWNAEIFYPPYLFTKDINNKTVLAERPKITKLKKNIKRGEMIDIVVNGEVSKVTLISTGSTTHAQNSESKFRNIDFKKISNNKIEISLDSNQNDLQNGTYLLFVLNSKGTPSEGKVVFVN